MTCIHREQLNRSKASRIAVNSGAVAIFLACIALTERQLGFWKDSISLFEHTIAITSPNPVAEQNLGQALATKGELDLAIEHYNKALEIWPGYIEAHFTLGNALAQKSRFDEALGHYQTASSLAPEGNLAPQIHFNMANAYALQSRHDDAEREFKAALQLEPGFADAHLNYATLLSMQGRLADAAEHFRHEARLRPESAESHCRLAAALAHLGRTAEAISEYQQGLRLQPDLVPALNDLATLLATAPDTKLRNPAEAVRLATRACELTGYANPVSMQILAGAYASAQQWDRAAATAQKAFDLASALGQTNLAETISSQLNELRGRSK